MSLKVWLPLLGSFENKGTSNINITLASGNTWASSGKIGNSSLTLTKLQTILPNSSCMSGAKEVSYAYWVKVNTAWSANWLDGIRWIDTDGSTTNTARQEFYTNCTLVGTWYKGGAISGKTFTPGVWTHIAATINYNTGEAKFYLNGILQGTASTVDTTYYCRGDFYIGDNGVDICQNDVRIYDNCLSAAEVKEISQGLVLHYKLDGFSGGLGNPNLYTGSRDFSGSWVNSGNWTTATETYQGFTVKQRSGTWGGLAQNITCTQNDIFTVSFYAKVDSGGQIMSVHRSSLGNVTTGLSILSGNFSSGTNWIITTQDGTQWKRYWATIQITSADITYLQWRIENNQSGKNLYVCGMKLEKGSSHTGWSPAESEGSFNTIQDSSGYGHNGTINSMPTISSETARYSTSTSFDGVDDCITVPYNAICPENIFTINLWFKKDTLGSKNYETLFGGPSGFEMDARAGSATTLSLYMASTRSGNRNAVTSMSLGNWYMITMTRDDTKEKYYVNGIYQSEIDAKAMPTGVYRIGAWASNTGQNYYGLISDFRIYATALSADDVLQLYHTGAKIDNKGNMHAFELNEQTENILFKVEKARTNLVYTDGLRSYTQANCQVTLTEQGYHIYRPPNLTTANDGNTMWGGLLINNQTTRTIASYDASRDNVWNLQKNHTYMFAFHAKGQSSNSPSLVVESNMGWDRIAGVGPNPTYLASNTIPVDFNGEQDCYIIFKIEDDVVKVATENKSSYVQGNSYLSYRELCLNYGYTATGTLGTDLYLTDFRLYDITNHMAEFTKMGQAKFYDFVEQMNKCKIRKNSELLATEFIEL